MKKFISTLLIVTLAITMSSLSVFADSENVTELSVTKAEPQNPTYMIHIPANTSLQYGKTDAQLLGTENDGVYIYNLEDMDGFYVRCTASGTQLTKDGDTETIKTNYLYKTSVMNDPNPIRPFICPTKAEQATGIYAQVGATDWNAASVGTYKATVTFTFDRIENPTISDVYAQVGDKKFAGVYGPETVQPTPNGELSYDLKENKCLASGQGSLKFGGDKVLSKVDGHLEVTDNTTYKLKFFVSDDGITPTKLDIQYINSVKYVGVFEMVN